MGCEGKLKVFFISIFKIGPLKEISQHTPESIY